MEAHPSSLLRREHKATPSGVFAPQVPPALGNFALHFLASGTLNPNKSLAPLSTCPAPAASQMPRPPPAVPRRVLRSTPVFTPPPLPPGPLLPQGLHPVCLSLPAAPSQSGRRPGRLWVPFRLGGAGRRGSWGEGLGAWPEAAGVPLGVPRSSRDQGRPLPPVLRAGKSFSFSFQCDKPK